MFGKSLENHEAQFPKFSVFIGQKNRYFVIIAFKMLKMECQIQVCNNNNENVNHFSQFISVKVKKKLQKISGSISKKLGKLRLRQNDGFLLRKICI